MYVYKTFICIEISNGSLQKKCSGVKYNISLWNVMQLKYKVAENVKYNCLKIALQYSTWVYLLSYFPPLVHVASEHIFTIEHIHMSVRSKGVPSLVKLERHIECWQKCWEQGSAAGILEMTWPICHEVQLLLSGRGGGAGNWEDV